MFTVPYCPVRWPMQWPSLTGNSLNSVHVQLMRNKRAPLPIFLGVFQSKFPATLHLYKIIVSTTPLVDCHRIVVPFNRSLVVT